MNTGNGFDPNNRFRFLAMAATFFLGAFNDNFYKQAAMLLAVEAGKSALQGVATILFSLPFIGFSAYAGWMADRFEKRRVIIGAKWLELLAMLFGAAGIVGLNWPCVLAMVGLMGLQSTFFAPALNGSIPELFSPGQVSRINAHLKTATTLAILTGIGCAGIVLDQKDFAGGYPLERMLVAAVVLAVACCGIVTAYAIPGNIHSRRPGRFPLRGPLDSITDFLRCRDDRELFRALWCSMFIYFVAAIAMLLMNTLGIRQFGWSQTRTGFLVVSVMLGMCLGAFLAVRLTHGGKWSSLLPYSAAGMSAALLLAAGVPLLHSEFVRFATYGLMLLAGTFGGMFLIPVTSFIQLRPKSTEKGKVIGISNFLDFTGILIAGQLFVFLDKFFLPSLSLGILGVFAAGCALWLWIAEYKSRILIRLLGWGLRLRYAISVNHFDTVTQTGTKGLLFLPNHPALIDPVILMATIGKRFVIRPLADRDQVTRPLLNRIIPILNPIELPSLEASGRGLREQVDRAIMEVNTALGNGENVLFYPAGRLYRSKCEDLRGNSGVSQILKAHPDIRVVMVATHGLWGSSFSWSQGRAPEPFRYLRKYLFSLLLNGIFFGPRRQVIIDFNVPSDFPRQADRHTVNRYLENFYNQDIRPNTHVPYTWFEGRHPLIVAEPPVRYGGESVVVAPHIRTKVLKHLRTLTGIAKFNDEDRLARDLGLDSLTVVELMVWVEHAFGVVLHDPERLVTVGSVLLAASGMLTEEGESTLKLKPVPPDWFDDPLTDNLRIPAGVTIPEVFLAQAARGLDRVVLADQIVGTKTFREIIGAIMALKPVIKAMPGEKIGIMFPASASATIMILAVMFSGKVPVMVNWTTGEGAMAHSLSHIGIGHVITSSALMERLKTQGLGFSGVGTEFVYIEALVKRLSLCRKIKILVARRLCWKHLGKAAVSDTAVVLFTSGTETLPKAVPLSHDNILVNMRDYVSMFDLKENIRLISMLPPFHSFGFSAGSMLPIVSGLKTVYHANPNEGATLAALIHAYRATLLVGTPTFVLGIMRSATAEQMHSLRLIVTGAEKCPANVVHMADDMCPRAVLCEGYGITECSPVVCVNHPDDHSRGGIGFLLPSIAHRIVHPETLTPLPYGRQGLLLLKGPSIFSGYAGDDVPSPFVRLEYEDWYNTGDLVEENPEHYLHFRGRLKRFIKRGGEMISLNAVEAVLESVFPEPAGDTPAFAVCATDSEEAPEIVLFTTHDLTLENINAAIRKQGLSGLHYVRKVIRVPEIPLLGTGKTDYRSLSADHYS